jgi:hypothetical protein
MGKNSSDGLTTFVHFHLGGILMGDDDPSDQVTHDHITTVFLQKPILGRELSL